MKIEIRTTGFYFTNSYIISNDKNECIIVDPGINYKSSSDYIYKNFKPLAVLLTHGHLDHIDGLEYFKDLPIYIYKDEIDLFFDNYKNLYYTINKTNPFNKGDLNLILVNDLDEIKINDFKFIAYHTPGHTECSVIYLIDDCLLTGDTLFKESIGRTDMPTGNYSKIMESLDRIFNTFNDNIKCLPGHGEITNIGYERINNPFYHK